MLQNINKALIDKTAKGVMHLNQTICQTKKVLKAG
jgi:hypothetical protein